MHPADIKAALEKKGMNQVLLAQRLGVSQSLISRIICGHTISDKVMKAIADVIGKHPAEVFPKYYLEPPKRVDSGRAV